MAKRRSFLLYPLSVLYRMATDIRNILYDTGAFRSEKFNFPVICIGNITAGGTGKTPHAEYLISLLQNDFRVALLSRGYKRRSRGFRIASQSSTTLEIGDEPLQIFSKFPGILVAADSDRVNGIKTIMREHPDTDLIILDDGFQHRSVKAGMNILLSDHGRLMTRDHLMPSGRLRENIRAKKRADIIVVTKTPAEITVSEMSSIVEELKPLTRQKVFFTTLAYGNLKPLFPEGNERELNKDTSVLLVTGIADPSPLLSYLEKRVASVNQIIFRDHHNFTPGDISLITSSFENLNRQHKIIVTTEKDSVRLKEITNIAIPIRENFYCLPVNVRFIDGEESFNKMITDYARKNR